MADVTTPTTQPTTERQQLVTLARQMERLLARRRKLNKKVTDLDDEIRRTRKFLNDLTLPDAGWAISIDATKFDAGTQPVPIAPGTPWTSGT